MKQEQPERADGKPERIRIQPHEIDVPPNNPFENAHPVQDRRRSGKRQRGKRDHQHRLRTVRPYEYTDAARLLADFWSMVDSVLKERGVLP